MTLRNRIECRRVRYILWDYAQQRLPEGSLETVERHLTCCARCRADLAQLQNAAKLLVSYNRQENTRPRTGWMELREQLISEPVTYVRTVPHQAPRPRRLVWAGAAFAATAMAGALVFVGIARFGHTPSLQIAMNRPQPEAPGLQRTSSEPRVAENNSEESAHDLFEAFSLATTPDPAPAEHMRPVVMHAAVPPHSPVRHWRPLGASFRHITAVHLPAKRPAITPADTAGEGAPMTELQPVSLETTTVTGSLVPASQDDDPE